MKQRKFHLARVVCSLGIVISGLVSATVFGSVAVSGASTAKAAPKALISSGRCALNEAAGQINFLSNYDWVMSPGIIDVLAASKLGYFKDMCLNVNLSASSSNIQQLVADDSAQIAREGAPEDVMTAQSAGEDVVGIATYSNVTINTLLVLANSKIKKLSQLNGKTIGTSGPMPPQITAMLEKEGVKMSTVKIVQTGYDPLFLARGQVVALSAYKSNEPWLLLSQGYKTRQFNPTDYGIKSSNATMLVNPSFLKEHPTAVEDFMRASLHAFNYCLKNVTACLNFGASMSGGPTAYGMALERKRWQVESSEAVQSQLPGKGIGAQTIAQWEPDFKLLEKYGLIKKGLSLKEMDNTTLMSKIYDGSKLIWPAP